MYTLYVSPGDTVHIGNISYIVQRHGKLYNVEKYDEFDEITREAIMFINGNLISSNESIQYIIDEYDCKNDFLAQVLQKVACSLKVNNNFYIQDKWIIDYIDKKLSNCKL